MREQLLEFGKQIVSLTRKTRQHEVGIEETQQEIKEIRQELQALFQTVQQLRLEQRHGCDRAVCDRENLLLRLENYLPALGARAAAGEFRR